MDKKRILIVDDEVGSARLLKCNLEQTGRYEARVENIATQALAAAEQFHPDLILLDVLMPSLDGGELARHFQNSPALRNVPIVFLTAAATRAEVASREGRIGGRAFLAKPVDVPEVIDCIDRHLGQPTGHNRGRCELVTLLFTDLVGSTALKQRLGDHAGAELIHQHHHLVRTTLAEFPEGEQMDAVGDSFLLIFVTPSAAVKFALTLQKRLREFNEQAPALVQDRMGLHLGEVLIREAGKEAEKGLVGLNVDLGARVMGLAQGGQILLTRPVFDLARQVLQGQDIEGVGALSWVSHGWYLFKGADEPLEICEVAEAVPGARLPPTTSDKAQKVMAEGSRAT